MAHRRHLVMTEIDEDLEFNNPTDIYNRAANWELAGLSEDKAYRLSAANQRRILGFYIGKGMVFCDWERKKAFNVVKCCFGTDTTYSGEFCLKTSQKSN